MATICRTSDGDLLDTLCYQQYGHLNGTVEAVLAAVRDTVDGAGVPLIEMVSDGPLKLRLNVPSRWLHALKVGTSFEVAIDETRKTYPAKVSAINARVDAVAQTVELEARIDGKPPELLAGMSGIARFPGLQ